MPTAPLQPCAEPRCPTLVSSGRCPAHDRQTHRPDRHGDRPHPEARRWYATVRWFRLRDDVIREAASTCAGCRHVVLELDVDHRIPHRGDPVLFWDRANLQALCKTCHAAKTHRGE